MSHGREVMQSWKVLAISLSKIGERKEEVDVNYNICTGNWDRIKKDESKFIGNKY